MQTLEHLPNPELDARLLEASRQTATESLERHLKVKEKHNWFVEDIISSDDLVTLLPYRHDVELEQGVGEAVEVFTHTEDGIVWYPRDVRKILHPSEKYPTGNDNDPHEAFARYWATEEFPHGIVGRVALQLLGRDLRKQEVERRIIVSSGMVPEANSTAEGLAFTSLQEDLTGGPYRMLVKKFREQQEKAEAAGKPEVALINQKLGLAYTEVAQDERLHRTFLSANVKAGVHSGDNELQGYLLSAIHNTYTNFQMPLQHVIPQVKRFVAIKKGGIFTPNMVRKSQHDMLKGTLKIDQIPGLHGAAAEIQEKLGNHILELEAKLEEAA